MFSFPHLKYERKSIPIIARFSSQIAPRDRIFIEEYEIHTETYMLWNHRGVQASLFFWEQTKILLPPQKDTIDSATQ